MSILKHEYDDGGRHRLVCTLCKERTKFESYVELVHLKCSCGYFLATTEYFNSLPRVMKVSPLKFEEKTIKNYEKPDRKLIHEGAASWEEVQI